MERLGLDHATVAAAQPRPRLRQRVRLRRRRTVGRPPRAGPARPVGLGAALGQRAPGDRPVPVGLSLADHLLSCHIAQGVVALLVRRARTGRGGLVETSLLEGMLDLQLVRPDRPAQRGRDLADEPGRTSPRTTPVSGVFATQDGWLALTAARDRLGRLLGDCRRPARATCPTLLRSRTTDAWLDLLDAADVWCSPVLTLEELLVHDAFARGRP